MILVDPPVWSARGRVWSHLASDVSYDELHAFAVRVGLHPYTYDGDHYDVPSDRYGEVVAAGAVPVPTRDLLGRVRAAGLRFHKRRGERPLAAVPDGVPGLSSPHRWDLVLSDREPPHETTVAAAVVVTDGRGRLLLVRDDDGPWDRPGDSCVDDESPRAAAAGSLWERARLDLPVTDLVACGYERTVVFSEGDPRRAGSEVDHVAVYRAVVSSPPLDGVGASAGWFDAPSASARCGGSPWWPLVERLRRAEASQSR